jgi:hypothetical protein
VARLSSFFLPSCNWASAAVLSLLPPPKVGCTLPSVTPDDADNSGWTCLAAHGDRLPVMRRITRKEGDVECIISYLLFPNGFRLKVC